MPTVHKSKSVQYTHPEWHFSFLRLVEQVAETTETAERVRETILMASQVAAGIGNFNGEPYFNFYERATELGWLLWTQRRMKTVLDNFPSDHSEIAIHAKHTLDSEVREARATLWTAMIGLKTSMPLT